MRSKLGIVIAVLGVAILIGTVMSNQATTPGHTQNQCDPSYPDFCIPAYSADLDCGQVPHQNFRVLSPDRHGFDQDKDGIGCEE